MVKVYLKRSRGRFLRAAASLWVAALVEMTCITQGGRFIIFNHNAARVAPHIEAAFI